MSKRVPDQVPNFAAYARRDLVDLRNLPALNRDEQQLVDRMLADLDRITTAHLSSAAAALRPGQTEFGWLHCTRCVARHDFPALRSREELIEEGWMLHPKNPLYLSLCPRHAKEARRV